jgi:hypothetical protein
LHLTDSYGIIAGSAMERIKIDFDKSGGLVPVITQDADTGEVLMLAHMNEQAFEETCAAGGRSTGAGGAGCGAKARNRATTRTCAESTSIATPTRSS